MNLFSYIIDFYNYLFYNNTSYNLKKQNSILKKENNLLRNRLYSYTNNKYDIDLSIHQNSDFILNIDETYYPPQAF